MKLSRFAPSPALVVALLALFVALGGVGYAATKIGTSQIRNGAVTAKKLHKAAVTNLKIKNRAVTSGKLADRAVTTRTIDGQAVGTDQLADLSVVMQKLSDQAVGTDKLADASVTAPKIATDVVGSDQLGPTQQVVSANTAIAANGNASVVVACPAGTQVLSGGGGANSFAVFAVESFQAGNGWIWVAHNSDAANAHTIFATAVCLQAVGVASAQHVKPARHPAGRPPVPAR